MVDFIELTNADRTGEPPVLVRKSHVIAIQPNDTRHHASCYIHLRSGDMFHVKQSYEELKERFKFE